MYNELNGIKREPDVKDESIYSFMSRRFGNEFAEKIVDPYFKNICSGDIKELSALSLLKGLYKAEQKYGSIIKGYMRGSRECKLVAFQLQYGSAYYFSLNLYAYAK